MVWTFDVNGTAGSQSEFLFRFKTALKSQGWTIPRSSDGLTYNSSGDQISSYSSGAGGMDNSRAWFVAKCPSGYGREICIQKDTNTGTFSTSIRMKYSTGISGGFSGGSPSATQTPSATDEQTIYGSGTDASPGFGAFGNGEVTRPYIAAGGLAEGYSVITFLQALSGYVIYSGFAIDTMISGSYSSNDPDPVVIVPFSTNGSSPVTTELYAQGASGAKTWLKKGLTDESWATVSTITPSTNLTTSVLNLVPGFPYNGEQESLSYIVWARSRSSTNIPAGVKGVSTCFRLVSHIRGHGTILSTSGSGSRDWIQIGSATSSYYAVPWNGSKALLTR